ncbi:GGDEF domain-containing protein [Roseomonas marmotae]|uniref:diguanylate cyclase n=1 Tax=Roseomonas marmotae TaxID=2768161 RepID=A0ABS3K7U0_9PROT|nr:diguanylate cyclase [Roseomonas marmotae]MBO1073524.1 diguanylate cyclase [Roseomonas marmotae]QTI80288.1 diguanylate cyclase [Roseomonas marmotae]
MADEMEDLRDPLRRLRAEGVQRLGERVEEVAAGWSSLAGRPSWDEEARQEARMLAAAAHRLAGAGGTFGFPAISAAAAPLEVMLLGLAGNPAASAEQRGQTAQLVEALRDAWKAGPLEALPLGIEAGPAAADRTADAVLLFVPPEQRTELAHVIGNLGYPVEQAGTLEELPASPRALTTALVDEAVPGALEACRRLSGQYPVILLAEEGDFSTRLAAARAGVSAVMARPLEVNELADWLDHFAAQGVEAGYSILVVDDDPLLAQAYALALGRAGMRVTAVNDPRETMETLSALHPDLILMDVQMPEVDGIELARVIRQTRRYLSLPIVFLSAEQDRTRQLLARRLGGDDFIPKPVDLDRLVTLVRLRAERARSLRAVMESDSLTGLLNHARFKERLALELEQAQRQGTELSLAIIDLDRFKSVNDTHGHLVGDRVIRGLARSLQKHLRRTDVIGRYGGEEFAALLPSTLPGAAAARLNQIRERFAATPFDGMRGAFRVSFSAGIASSARHMTAEALISAADAALYAAKRAGRNRVNQDTGP